MSGKTSHLSKSLHPILMSTTEMRVLARSHSFLLFGDVISPGNRPVKTSSSTSKILDEDVQMVWLMTQWDPMWCDPLRAGLMVNLRMQQGGTNLCCTEHKINNTSTPQVPYRRLYETFHHYFILCFLSFPAQSGSLSPSTIPYWT